MPIHKTDGKFQWGNHGKKYKSRQKAVNQMRAAFANGYRESVNEEVKDNPAKQVAGVPGLKYLTHDVAGIKYFSLQHEKSKKFLMKPMRADKVRLCADLAAHHFRGFDFEEKPEEIVKQAPHIHKALDQFRQDVDRIHKPDWKAPKNKKKSAKVKKK